MHVGGDQRCQLIHVRGLRAHDHVVGAGDVLGVRDAGQFLQRRRDLGCLPDLGLDQDVSLDHRAPPAVIVAAPDRLVPIKEDAIPTVGETGEFALIARITARLAAPQPPLGPGDDAAVLPAPDGRVVATTDLLVEGRHFRLDWSTPIDVGYKAAAQNLADVAAMGARPTALLVGLSAPASTPVEVAEGFADGLRLGALAGRALVVGGDIVRGDSLTLAVTALGDLQGLPPVLRSGARGGGLVIVGGGGRGGGGGAPPRVRGGGFWAPGGPRP